MGKDKKKVKVFKKKKKPVPEKVIIENLKAKYEQITETNIKTFNDLPISPKTLRALKENGFVHPTDIQKQSIGLALKGNDILGAAKTGSGKTLAFLIPVIEKLFCQQYVRDDGLGALIITPTRELAFQIYETLRKIGCYHDFSAGLIIGGQNLKFETKRIDKCNIIICTPGRLLEHMNKNPLLDSLKLQILVLDEADRCLDLGFEQDMNAIIENLPQERQTLLFSATQTKSVKDLARLSLKDPIYISVHEHAAHMTPDGLQQSYIVCNLEDKLSILWSFLRNHLKQKVIVFFSSCKQVKYINEVFCRMRPGISLLALYGTLHQEKRMKIYETFCKKQSAVLFATDIAARGLDFPSVNWVVQMDCPEDTNAYIHRAGRTARLHKGGESLLVLLESEREMINQLEERNIPISMIKINQNKLQSPHRKLEALLARDVALKESAQRAFIAYVKSVFLMRDKTIFNVHKLDTDAFAKSLGLAIPPRIRFLRKYQDAIASKEKNSKKSADLEIEKLSAGLRNDETDDEQEEKETFKENNRDKSSFVCDDSDDDCLTIKRKNIDLESFSESEELPDSTKDKQAKAVTKAAIAKKLLKKKIKPNKKVVFDEQGEEVLDPTRSKVSELAKQYEQDDHSGINIEMAKKILQEEDKFDKERFKKKIKEKHKEEKRKLKAAKKEEEERFDSDEQSDYEPDLSWLPDPDKIYGKERKSDGESESEADNIEENYESDESEEQIHRPTKRKLVTQKEHKESRKKSKFASGTNDLQLDEELALQLLQN